MIKLKNILIEQEQLKKRVQSSKNNIINIANKVDKLGIGSPVATFLTRVASVESCYGLAISNENYFQVDPIAFQDTQDSDSHPGLVKKFKVLKSNGINWPKLTYNDIKSNGYYNGIAARLMLGNQPGKIPNDLKGQANYWKSNYNTSAGKGTVNDFIEKNSGDTLSGCVAYAK